jgi:Bacteriophage Mu Gam like protein
MESKKQPDQILWSPKTEAPSLPTLGQEAELPGGFQLDSREKCDWFLSKLADFDAEEMKIKSRAAQIVAQMEAMIARNKTDRDAFQGRFYQQFQNFVAGEIAADKKGRKSVIFFNGTAGFRTVPPALVLESAQDAMTTARAVLPSSITKEEREKFDREAFLTYAREHFASTGEILPGLKRTEETERFSVKIAAGKESAEGAK